MDPCIEFGPLFVRKQPCRSVRLLDEAFCPPFDDIVRDFDNYIIYYDPLYYPELNRHVFMNPVSICEWMEWALPRHIASCPSCSCHLRTSYFECSVSYSHAEGFHVTLKHPTTRVERLVSIEKLSSASYTHCRAIANVNSLCIKNPICSGEVNEKQLRLIPSLLSDLPSWLFDEEPEYQRRLESLRQVDLMECCRRLLDGALRRTKKEAIQAILDRFLNERRRILEFRTVETWDAFCTANPHLLLQFQYPARLLSIATYFHSIFGGAVFGSLRNLPHHLAQSYVVPAGPLSENLSWLLMPIETLSLRLQTLTKVELLNAIKSIPSWRRPQYDARSRPKSATSAADQMRRRVLYLCTLSEETLYHCVFSISPESVSSLDDLDRDFAIHTLLRVEYTSTLTELLVQVETDPEIRKAQATEKLYAQRKQSRRDNKILKAKVLRIDQEQNRLEWPVTPSKDLIFDCLRRYREGTVWVEPPVCSCCAQLSPDTTEITVTSQTDCYPPVGYRKSSRLALELLAVDSLRAIRVSAFENALAEFTFPCRPLNGLMLDKAGIVSMSEAKAVIRLCSECISSLCAEKVPRFALANWLYRGHLPEQLSDLTWVEEMVCALYRNTAHITRLYGSSDPVQPTVLHGNTCAHEMNVISTAEILPRTPVDVSGMLSIVFVGARKPTAKSLAKIFRVRKNKIMALLQWLQRHNHLYANIPIDASVFDLYPEDGLLPGLEDRLIHDEESKPEHLFSEETAGFSDHPAAAIGRHESNEHAGAPNDSVLVDEHTPMIERMGVTDPEAVRIPGRTFKASALKNLATSLSDEMQTVPDLIIRRSNTAVPEYNNPTLMPGMFPTLFPFGIGGFEDKERPTPISFQQQAQYYFNISDRAFRYHFSYMFIVLNIIQRRSAHLHTYFTCSRSNFDTIARKLVQVSPDVLQELANKVEQEKSLKNLSTEQQVAMDLLKHVDTIGARVPGSQASKLLARNEIRNFFGHFGLPHLFLTFNPSPAHSPIFLVMSGDKSVNLLDRFPQVPPARERALALARDPVAAADFFEFCVNSLFNHLLGWDYKTGESTPNGGILGRLRAFYGTTEFTERGCLHGHFLIWLDGAPNPSDLHKLLEDNTEFQERFFEFFENIIHHHLPDVEVCIESTFDPRIERPPLVPKSQLSSSEAQETVVVPECKNVLNLGSLNNRRGDVNQIQRSEPQTQGSAPTLALNNEPQTQGQRSEPQTQGSAPTLALNNEPETQGSAPTPALNNNQSRLCDPAVPLSSLGDAKSPLDILHEWDTVYATEVKKCGEVLQRHTCRSVCHKYGNENRCRFLFPHEIVDASYYDPDMKSVVLLCRDSTVNYFNPYILIFCRHNHDLKCILSGKSAKAAMFYITDYITKMSLSTYETLSLMSKAVACMPQNDTSPPLAAARLLLHKCLSQFTRQQQVHAQQAARYLRGFNDTISSHKTIPMMSGLVLTFVKEQYCLKPGTSPTTLKHIACHDEPSHSLAQVTAPQGESDVEDNTEDDIEPIPLRIAMDYSGKLIDTTQVHHYWFRGESLKDMSFYDFCRFTRVEKKSRTTTKNTHETRLGVLRRHDFRREHPLSTTHQIIEHTNPAIGDGHRELVPRIIGSNIPRESSDAWPLFALSHFKPFSIDDPLLVGNATPREVFSSYEFSSDASCIMKNWNAIHECEDERDADRLRKQAAFTKESQAMTCALAMQGKSSGDDADTPDDTVNVRVPPDQEFRTWQTVTLLQEAGWFSSGDQNIKFNGTEGVGHPVSSNVDTSPKHHLDDIVLTPEITSKWKKSIRTQEKMFSNQRKNILNPETQDAGSHPNFAHEDGETAHPAGFAHLSNSIHPPHVPIEFNGETSGPKQTSTATVVSQDDMLAAIEAKYSLNERQTQAFRIISKHYVARFIDKNPAEKPMRMLMTGPGGTGKTHVVKAVKSVMSHYGCGHRIRFLAPTGSAASNINGVTVHKGLGIKIAKKDGRGKGSREIGSGQDDLTILVSIQNKTQLRDEWRHVDVVLIDEVSLISAQLLCEIDQALRFAKETHDTWFGGATMIFAGDFYQYPPVGGTPLYTPIPVNGKQTNDELLRRLGRLAWKSIDTVVELTEQQRMKSDTEYGQAVQRLRLRQCTAADVNLFNSRVIKGSSNTNGVDLGTVDGAATSAIVSTNHLREVLNLRKAHSVGGRSLIICASQDIVPRNTAISKEEYESLLKLNFSSSKNQGSLPGFLPLYESMPVVLRLRNISTELGITNGSQGIVRKIFTDTNEFGYTHCKCAIVEFKDSPVKIHELPLGHFPIFPVTYSYPKKLKMNNTGGEEIVRVQRHQLPLQPGFAVTGHSAQGKTLPSVLAFLNEGGFGAYVAASRATSRHGLCIVNPVSQADLNKPLPSDLFFEMQRMDVLKDNTFIRHGFVSGPLALVPDPELAEKKTSVSVKFLASATDDCVGTKSTKRKRLATSNSEPDQKDLDQHSESTGTEAGILFDSRPIKRRRFQVQISNNSNDSCQTYESCNQAPTSGVLSAGCQWSAADWSCAYDSVYMALFVCVAQLNPAMRTSFGRLSKISNFLLNEFEVVWHNQTAEGFNVSRDRLRDLLSCTEPDVFPRTGQVGASVTSIIDCVLPPSIRYHHCILPCSTSCLLGSPGLRLVLPSILITQGNSPIPLGTHLQEWFAQEYPSTAGVYPVIDHSNCEPMVTESPSSDVIEDESTSTISQPWCHPILIFEAHPIECSVYPSPFLTVPCTSNKCHYRLAAIIYHGERHFCARFVVNNISLWNYDGQVNHGSPILEHFAFDTWQSQEDSLPSLASCGSKNAHVYMYTHVGRGGCWLE